MALLVGFLQGWIFLVIPKMLPRAGAEDGDRSRKRERGGQLLLQQQSRVKLCARHCGVPRLDKEVPGDRDPGCSSWPFPSFNPVTRTFTWRLGQCPGWAMSICLARFGPAGAEGHCWPGRTFQRPGRGTCAGPQRWQVGALGLGREGTHA